MVKNLSILTILFGLLGALMLPILLLTFFNEGFPFRKQILTPIATCAYIVVQYLKLTPSQESSDHMYHIMLRNGTELKTKYSFVVTLRILFSILGAVMIGTLVYTLVTDGSPFRRELLTRWMLATLAGFYINVLALTVWVAYKESSWICAVFWTILLICFGSVATCAYVVWQLFQISCYDPAYFILVKHNHRQARSNRCWFILFCKLIGSKIDSYFNYADRGLGSRLGCLGKYLAPMKRTEALDKDV
ncbi:hypothetical protein TSUD_42350 [Trifolium subterraneum]|uniref:Uncharacterized protein n=1 Tax=Trifolium subterraneum TaxID=3900 RepID=A0A2Z6MEF7_TRISU|nr:hypothetical protein TSUD_42350 [Trifolium subterraneum]